LFLIPLTREDFPQPENPAINKILLLIKESFLGLENETIKNSFIIISF